MKKNLLLPVFVWAVIFSNWTDHLFAQKADTVTVVAPMPGDLYKFIEKDTLPNGNRVNPNRYYRLERGKVYVVNAVMYFRHNVNLIADKDDPKNPKRPPILVNGKLGDGSNNLIMVALMKSNINCLFKNIFFQGVSATRTQGDDNQAFALGGDSIRLSVDGCVFNAFGMQSIVIWGKANKFYIRNNIFRNMVQNHPFKGQLIANSGALDQDTLVMTNNTSFNNNSYFWAPLQAIMNYEKIEHNTLYTSIVNVFYSPWMVNSEIRDNIFYGMLGYGQMQSEIDGGWYDFNKSLSSVISVTTISSFILGLHGMKEADRKITVSNNAYFWPQKIKNYWAQTPNMFASDLWMNTRTLDLFADKTKHPNFLAENNISADPQFDATMESWVLDSVVSWSYNMRTNSKSSFRNYNVGSTDFLLPAWPLPEKLAYANTQLQTAGHDGLPIGDLNWFPAAKNQWNVLNGFPLENTMTGVQSPFQANRENLHLSNFPNPANLLTTVSFNLPSGGNTVLKIYNIQGKEMATIVSSKLDKGSHNYQFDTRDLPSGVYVCYLNSGNLSAKSKLIVTK